MGTHEFLGNPHKMEVEVLVQAKKTHFVVRLLRKK